MTEQGIAFIERTDDGCETWHYTAERIAKVRGRKMARTDANAEPVQMHTWRNGVLSDIREMNANRITAKACLATWKQPGEEYQFFVNGKAISARLS